MKAHINLQDGSNLTEISPLLTCIHTLNESNILWDEGTKYFGSLSLKQLKSENDVNKEDGFCFVVSLRDGSCLYTSNAINDHLGYPKDMLCGQCIMNFLFQKDHITFANHLTQGLNACFIQGKKDNTHLVLNTFFCRLRVYHSLRHGYAISDQKTQFKPFKITLHIKEMIVNDLCVETSASTLAVKATATVVPSAYSVPDEIPAMTSFSTRHTASCHFSHVDASAIPYFGYLPQDMIGFSVFDFYHVDDLPQLKEIYELVIQEQGSSFRSKPYRFKVQNGCYIMLETEWSCFVNPWAHKLEFVVGQHRVLKGPSDIDIFAPSEFEDIPPPEIQKESLVIQKEIKTLLAQPIPSCEKKSKKFCKRKRDLASFVYNCVDESLKGESIAEKPLDVLDEGSHLDPESVVMGDISPYREANDSSVSSDTPPTIQQIRYQENIERFFASQPRTHSDGSEESTKHEKVPSVEDSQGSCTGSGNGSGNTSTSKGVESPQTTSLNNFENNNQSGSNSSKCNMSSFDSGYGKSIGKNTILDPSVSQAGSSAQMWPKDTTQNSANNVEKFSPCLALTEESLSVHNRNYQRHFKQRKTKSGLTAVPLKDSNWIQQKDCATAKNRKNVQTQTLNAAVTSPAAKMKLGAEEQANIEFRSSSEQKPMPNAQDGSLPGASFSNSYLFSPSQCAPTPTPFYIPVMYMGTLPYYPPGPNSQPHWPFGPVSAPVVPPATSKPSTSASDFYTHLQHGFPNFSGNGPSNFVPGMKSGISTSVTTTTNSVTTQTAAMYKNDVGRFPLTEAIPQSLCTAKKQDVASDRTDFDMLVDESLSSYTRSSSFQSADKSDEDMDFDVKRAFVRARSDKVDLPMDVAYRYQMSVLSIADVLKKDREVLQSMQQPDMVNRQLRVLQEEREEENENKLKVDEDDFCMTEDVMLGLATEDDLNEELEYREESLLQLMCEDS